MTLEDDLFYACLNYCNALNHYKTTREEMLYKDIKEISFQYDVGAFTRFWQKRMNIGNIVIYPLKGNVLIYGIELANIAPFDKLMVDIKNNIGDKIVNG